MDTLKTAWLPLRRRTFRSLWLAQLGSNIGMWMQTVGAQWFLVERSDSSALVAWAQTANLLPALLLSLLAGVLADGFDRRRLIIWTTVASTAAAAVMAWMSYVDVLTAWSLLLITFALGAAGALTAPAWQAIQPELVPREEIRAAAGLGSVTINAARAVGPAIGGSGPALVFALNALSFVGVVIAVAAWKRPACPIRRARASGERHGRWRALHVVRADRATYPAPFGALRSASKRPVGASAGHF